MVKITDCVGAARWQWVTIGLREIAQQRWLGPRKEGQAGKQLKRAGEVSCNGGGGGACKEGTGGLASGECSSGSAYQRTARGISTGA